MPRESNLRVARAAWCGVGHFEVSISTRIWISGALIPPTRWSRTTRHPTCKRSPGPRRYPRRSAGAAGCGGPPAACWCCSCCSWRSSAGSHSPPRCRSRCSRSRRPRSRCSLPTALRSRGAARWSTSRSAPSRFRRTSPRRSSRSRTGGSTIIGASIRAGWRAPPGSTCRTGKTEGGSTITQQLAKFTFLTPDQTLGRKMREIFIAFWLEAWLTKDQILERYLSNAYFGDNAYGLRAASLHYFNRQPEQLSVGQAAMLAGLVKAPSKLAPTHSYDLAEKRMRLVLHAMAEAGYLTPQQAATTPDPRLDVRTRGELPTGTYFADWALPAARRLDPVSYALADVYDHARCTAAGGGAAGDRAHALGRRASRSGGDALQWRGRGDGRWQGLCRIAVQPRDAGTAPAWIDLQAVRLSDRAGRRMDARGPHRQHRDHRSAPTARRTRAGATRPRSRSRTHSRNRATSRRCGSTARSATRR